eukprot:GHVP01032584.1.p1 GENE.GHVP01032584.1~~GHVP01032584.1.p1  ORF type:complete len:295 (+),score=59.57 GHVP01032584.1:64-885(+)
MDFIGKNPKETKEGGAPPGAPILSFCGGEWTKIVDDPPSKYGLKVWQQWHKKTSWITYRVEALIDHPLLHVLSICSETPLLTEWIPHFKMPFKLGLKQAKKLDSYGRVEKLAHLDMDMPWPMKNRDVAIDSSMVDDLENKRYNFFFRSLDPDYDCPFTPCAPPEPFTKGAIRINLQGGVALLPKGANNEKTVIQLIFDFDTKEKLPDAVLKWFGSAFIRGTFQKFAAACSVAHLPTTKYYELRHNDQHLYAFCEESLKKKNLLTKGYGGDVTR